MDIIINRIARRKDYTIGNMYVDGVYFCDTLEDTDRGLKASMSEDAIRRKKVAGKTAIPSGTYRIDMDTVSQKYKSRKTSWAKPYGYKVPRLVGVKGFSGILIHVGNKPEDTEGCILVGQNKMKGMVLGSNVTFHELMDIYLLPAHQNGERITLEVR